MRGNYLPYCSTVRVFLSALHERLLACPRNHVCMLPSVLIRHICRMQDLPDGERPLKRRRHNEAEGEASGPPAGGHSGPADEEGVVPPAEGRLATWYVNTWHACVGMRGSFDCPVARFLPAGAVAVVPTVRHKHAFLSVVVGVTLPKQIG
jgi:hypothetical protein